MRTRIASLALALLVVFAFAASTLCAQSGSSATAALPRELALSYNWAHSNAPAGGCGCFSLNGGGLSVAWPANRKGFALTAEFDLLDQPNATAAGDSLTLGTLLVGGRYRLASPKRRLTPFAEVAIGPTHASGKLAASAGALYSSRFAFAGLVGGGVDLALDRRWSWRMGSIDYLATTFPNGSNNHQNNLRLSTGLVFRF